MLQDISTQIKREREIEKRTGLQRQKKPREYCHCETPELKKIKVNLGTGSWTGRDLICNKEFVHKKRPAITLARIEPLYHK